MLVQGEENQHPARNGKELLLPEFCSVLVGRDTSAHSRGQAQGRDLALRIPKAHPCG